MTGKMYYYLPVGVAECYFSCLRLWRSSAAVPQKSSLKRWLRAAGGQLAEHNI